jgi:hypothetical protein
MRIDYLSQLSFLDSFKLLTDVAHEQHCAIRFEKGTVTSVRYRNRELETAVSLVPQLALTEELEMNFSVVRDDSLSVFIFVRRWYPVSDSNLHDPTCKEGANLSATRAFKDWHTA